MNQIKFTVPTRPTSKLRARSVMRRGKMYHYTAPSTVNYERLVAIYAHRAIKECKINVIETAIKLELVFEFKMTKKMLKKTTEPYNEHSVIAHTHRPDLDNLIKSVKDACNKILWIDDSQVYSIVASKFFGRDDKVHVIVNY